MTQPAGGHTAASSDANFSKFLTSSHSSHQGGLNKLNRSDNLNRSNPLTHQPNKVSSLYQAHNSVRANQKEFRYLKNQRFRRPAQVSGGAGGHESSGSH